LTLFPEMFLPVLNTGIPGRALKKGLVTIGLHNIRDYAIDRHGTVDDTPYGGGAGMVLRPEPLASGIKDIKERFGEATVIFLTPQGEQFKQSTVVELSLIDHIILLCGHYKGIDERIRIRYVDREISLGDFVLSGGEIPAIAVTDAIIRLLPGVLGDFESGLEDSFHRIGGKKAKAGEGRILLEGPCYTRPPEFDGMKVPDVLISGHHKDINTWRDEMAFRRTQTRRPDLLKENASKKNTIT